MYVGIIGALMASDISGKEKFYLPVTGGHSLFTGPDCADQSVRN